MSICELFSQENVNVSKSEVEKVVIEPLIWKKNVAENCKFEIEEEKIRESIWSMGFVDQSNKY